MRRLLAISICVAAMAACGGNDAPAGTGTTRAAGTTASTSTSSPPPAASPTSSEPAAPDLAAVSLRLTEVVGGLDKPVAMAIRPGDDAIYVAQQSGRVVAVRDGRLETVLDLSAEVSDGYEQGLLGLAFSPDAGRMYVDFTDREGDTHVEELAVSDRGVDTASRRVVLTVDQPFPNHNGGQLTFGPDRMLYIGLGDGGGAGDPIGNGQNLGVLLGKILRIDPRPDGDAAYTVPDDNPFVGRAGARGEVWDHGLRNPWRFSFDRQTGDLWIGDVGQGSWEEVDYAPAGDAGVNWGWDRREGSHPFEGETPQGARDPIHEYPNPEQGDAVTGGFVYRGRAIPALRGAYVFADSSKADLIGLVQADGSLIDVRPLGVNGGFVSSFGEDAAGELYVLDLAGGRLLRVDPA